MSSLFVKKVIPVIVGPTGVGKTALSLLLAKEFNGEIISADSMQIYRGMDIGTAKVSKEERENIPHHLIDIREPTETYSVSDYLNDVNITVKDILSRGKIPFIVGGTGLYVSSFMNNLQLFEEADIDSDFRNELKRFALENGNEALHEKLHDVDIESYYRLPINDTKRIIRALEIYKATGKTIGEQNLISKSIPSPYQFLTIGLTCEKREILYDRINHRVDRMLELGLVNEVRRLNLPSCSSTARQAIGYREIQAYLEGHCSIDEAAENIRINSRHYAKRQLTWFRRDKSINWEYTDPDENGHIPIDYIFDKYKAFLSK